MERNFGIRFDAKGIFLRRTAGSGLRVHFDSLISAAVPEPATNLLLTLGTGVGNW
jgi:hypothetical protein